MANKPVKISIEAEVAKAVADIAKLSKEVDQLTKENKKLAKTSQDVGKLNDSYKSMSNSVKVLAAGIVALGVASKAVEFTSMAADAAQASDAFNKVVTEMGADADEEFKKIKEASKGLISEADMKQSATTALSLGVPLESLAGLMEIARAKSREMGTDAKTAFEDLAKGIGRGSVDILDNLGLTIKLGDAYQDMAKELDVTVDSLTKKEKIQALVNASTLVGSKSVERYADASLSAKEQVQAMNAQLDDLKVVAGTSLLPTMRKLTKGVSDFVDSLTPEDIGRMQGALENLGKAAVFLAKSLALSVEGWSKMITLVDEYGGKAFETVFSSVHESLNEMRLLREEVEAFDGSEAAFDKLATSIQSAIAANAAQAEQWSKTDPEFYAEKIARLDAANKQLMRTFADLQTKKPYKVIEDSAKGASVATDDLVQKTEKLSDAQKKQIETDKKLYKDREKEHLSSINTLIKQEAAAWKAIEAEAIRHQNALSSIEKQRISSNISIEASIAAIQRNSLSTNLAQYNATQIAAAQALKKAKEALAKGEFEQYKQYISQAQSLYTQYANSAIEDEGKVKVSKKATAQAGIDGLKSIQTAQDAYYSALKTKEDALHQQKMTEAEANRTATIAQLELQYALLEASAELVKVLSGGKVEIDTKPAYDKIQELKKQYEDIGKKPVDAKIDIDEQDLKKQKIAIEKDGVTIDAEGNTAPLKNTINIERTDQEGNPIIIKEDGDVSQLNSAIAAERARQESNPIVISIVYRYPNGGAPRTTSTSTAASTPQSTSTPATSAARAAPLPTALPPALPSDAPASTASAATAAASSAPARSSAPQRTVNVNFVTNEGTYPMQAEEAVADALAEHLRRSEF